MATVAMNCRIIQSSVEEVTTSAKPSPRGGGNTAAGVELTTGEQSVAVGVVAGEAPRRPFPLVRSERAAAICVEAGETIELVRLI